MALFKNKYRIASARLKSWDYSSNAAYFVTICTAGKEQYFGDIIDAEMHLSRLGIVADGCWQEIPAHFPFVELGEHVIMPNHVHGIIIIKKPVTPQIQNRTPNKFAPQSKNLASIVRGFKVGVTKFAQQNDMDFEWQSRFHDHIIRDEDSFIKIQNYILTNPQRWIDDKFYAPK